VSQVGRDSKYLLRIKKVTSLNYGA